MTGERTVTQETLFCKFSLELSVLARYLLPWIDRFVDLSGLSAVLRYYYCDISPPSINSELMNRMPLNGVLLTEREGRIEADLVARMEIDAIEAKLK